MSLFIKGMEMPESGEILDILIFPNGEVQKRCSVNGFQLVQEASAVSVPTPHGRLIDADKMNETNIGLLNTLRRCQVAVCWLKHCEIFAMPDNDGFCSECAWNFLKEHDMTLKEAGHD